MKYIYYIVGSIYGEPTPLIRSNLAVHNKICDQFTYRKFSRGCDPPEPPPEPPPPTLASLNGGGYALTKKFRKIKQFGAFWCMLYFNQTSMKFTTNDFAARKQ